MILFEVVVYLEKKEDDGDKENQNKQDESIFSKLLTEIEPSCVGIYQLVIAIFVENSMWSYDQTK